MDLDKDDLAALRVGMTGRGNSLDDRAHCITVRALVASDKAD